MAKNQYVIEALTLIDDANYGNTTYTYYRNGARGHLHGRRACWKAEWNAEAVTMPIKEAASKQTCRECFTDAIRNDGGTLDAALKLVPVARDAAAIEALLAGTPSVEKLGSILTRVSVDLKVVNVHDSHQGVYKTCTALQERIKKAQARAIQQLTSSTDTMLATAAADLLVVGDGERETPQHAGVPYATSEMLIRAGRVAQERHAQLLPHLWSTWKDARPSGADNTSTAVTRAAESLAHLGGLDQLIGVKLSGSDDAYALDAVLAAWRAAVNADVTALLAKWEHDFRKNMDNHEVVTVAANLMREWRIEDALTGMLRAFPHASGNKLVVGNYPMTVAHWITGTLGARDTTILTERLTGEQLEIAVTLWDPGNRSSAYSDPEAAASAARTI